jgi:hypothetical protein
MSLIPLAEDAPLGSLSLPGNAAVPSRPAGFPCRFGGRQHRLISLSCEVLQYVLHCTFS